MRRFRVRTRTQWNRLQPGTDKLNMDDELDPVLDDIVRWELELLAHDLGLIRPEFDSPDTSFFHRGEDV